MGDEFPQFVDVHRIRALVVGMGHRSPERSELRSGNLRVCLLERTTHLLRKLGEQFYRELGRPGHGIFRCSERGLSLFRDLGKEG